MATRDISETGSYVGEQTTQQTEKCPECRGRVRSTSGERACRDCGLVLEESRIDHGPEWRYCDRDEAKRTGGPRTAARHDRGLSTTIGYTTDARGDPIPESKRRRLHRLRREHKRGQFESTADRNQMRGFLEIRRLTGSLDVPETLRDQACRLFSTSQTADLLRGRSVESIATACVYGACRTASYSLTLEELLVASQVSRSRVVNAYKTLNRELGLPATIITPKSQIPKIASELNLDDVVRRRACELASRAQEMGITNGRQPSGVAAACVYKASQTLGDQRTQKAIADVANTTPMTLRERYYELKELEREA
ncbi:transcription initiation factor IIB [Halopenitus persicus]|uniref:Transcription initiation factor TFIIB n=1 Tax=Halopenitus persicus TaxID=1048396 RepID=A0A1H3P5R8_9EURY|nr:transcription initiation factor IIB family protein [Halopenitus persicus]SDY96145.1 transcription initiation factor TFIIB [Halopenitus persicus]